MTEWVWLKIGLTIVILIGYAGWLLSDPQHDPDEIL